MLAGVIFFVVGTLVAIAAVSRRDRRYTQKPYKEVASDEMKKFLNLPHSESSFPDPAKARTQKKPSSRLLESLNSEEDKTS